VAATFGLPADARVTLSRLPGDRRTREQVPNASGPGVMPGALDT
jgi:hypothetical protein